MKLIDKFYDNYEKILTNIYQTDNGIRIVESINPKSVEFAFDVLIQAGSLYEDMYKYKYGTAHFLEHLMCKPNKKYRTKKSLIEATQGNLRRPYIYTNASTSFLWINFYSFGNHKGMERGIDYIGHQINYPEKLFKKYIEEERKIILNEYSRLPLKNKNSSINYDIFFYSNLHKNYKRLKEYVIGSKKTIESINLDDLHAYKDQMFKPQNMIFTILTPQKLTKTQKKLILKIVKEIKENNEPQNEFIYPEPKNELKFKIFEDEKNNGIFISINKFYAYVYQLNIKNRALCNLLSGLISEVSFRYLREEKNLVYSAGGFKSIIANLNNVGFSTTINFDNNAINIKNILNCINEMFVNQIFKFINSNDFDKWLISEKSKLIFKINSKIDIYYALDIGEMLARKLNIKETYEDYIKEVKKIKKEEILQIYKEWLNTPAGFWIVTNPKNKNEIEKIFPESELFKYYKNLTDYRLKQN